MTRDSEIAVPRRGPGIGSWYRIIALAFTSLTLAEPARAQARWSTLDEFLSRGIRLNAKDLAAIARGETFAKMLPTADTRDIAVFGAVQIDVPRSFFIDRQRDFPRSLRTPTRA